MQRKRAGKGDSDVNGEGRGRRDLERGTGGGGGGGRIRSPNVLGCKEEKNLRKGKQRERLTLQERKKRGKRAKGEKGTTGGGASAASYTWVRTCAEPHKRRKNSQVTPATCRSQKSRRSERDKKEDWLRQRIESSIMKKGF